MRMGARDKVDELLTVGEISKRSGIAISAIHFYEARQLIRSTRDSANRRRFARRELRVLSIIKVAQRLGLTLDEIAAALKDIPSGRIPSKADWQKVSRVLDKVLQERIDLATRLREQLNLCIGCGCLSLDDCPLRNPDDKYARKGPGAHLL
jgi:MerR family redox-sensitive transcriptional activator SoxR